MPVRFGFIITIKGIYSDLFGYIKSDSDFKEQNKYIYEKLIRNRKNYIYHGKNLSFWPKPLSDVVSGD